jgi:TRAP-type mannitol/chloroaromatic compound transport system permease small subunit
MGQVVRYFIFVMIGIVLWSSISKIFFLPSSWALEMALFAMVAYFILGGPCALQLGANVRKNILCGSWKPRQKAWLDLALKQYNAVMEKADRPCQYG